MSAPSSRSVSDRRRSLGRFLAIAILLACPVGGYLITSTNQTRPPEPNHGLVVSEEALNLGDVWESNDLPWTIPIKNPTDTTVEIVKLASSCGCAVIDPASLVLSPGETKRIHLRLNLTRRPQAPVNTEFKVQITPEFQSLPLNNPGWLITARVKTALVVSPSRVDFTYPLLRGHGPEPQTVLVTGNSAVADLELRYEASHLRVACSKVDDRENTYKIRIGPHMTAPAGPFAHRLDLRAHAKDGRVIGQRSIVVTGLIQEQVQASPSSVLFGLRRIGESAEETISLDSQTKTPFAVCAIRTQDPSTEVLAASQPMTKCRTFQIRQRIKASGHRTSMVTFLVDIANDQEREIRVPISYYGVNR